MTYQQIIECTAYIQSKTDFKPITGIILGTGLSSLANDIDIIASFEYKDLPHFPISTVETHQGRLLFGYLNQAPVVVMQGRFHFYEGYTMKQVTFPVRVMKMLGIENIYISNVSGGLNPAYEMGDIVVIEDHINLQYENPLTGHNMDELGVRFPDMLDTYNPAFINKAYAIGKDASYTMHKGVYVSVPGPNLETKAEYKFLRTIGADCVGMSTVPEVIVARHMKLNILTLSIITDLCYEPRIKKTNIKEIIEVANTAEPKLCHIIKQMV